MLVLVVVIEIHESYNRMEYLQSSISLSLFFKVYQTIPIMSLMMSIL